MKLKKSPAKKKTRGTPPPAKEPRAAIRWFRERVPLKRKAWDELNAKAKRKAFTVSGVTQLEIVAQVQDSLERAVAKGMNFETWRKLVRPLLEDAWKDRVENPAWRLETIFRTNVQAAYMAGRVEHFDRPEIRAALPIWEFSGIMDARQTPVCDACNDHRAESSAPWWRTHTPPLHFNCRSTIIALSLAEGQARGLKTAAPSVKADPGFGQDPRESWGWKPDLHKYPAPLAAAYKAKQARKA